jgi:hypothetical protein
MAFNVIHSRQSCGAAINGVGAAAAAAVLSRSTVLQLSGIVNKSAIIIFYGEIDIPVTALFRCDAALIC